ncbi:MAG: TonB-dependent receptor [Vicinamibacterales bacterium]
MRVRFLEYVRQAIHVLSVSLFLLSTAHAADTASLRGTVVDPLGAVVVGARVEALRDGAAVRETTTGADGKFLIEGLAEGRYVVAATAGGFERRVSDPVWLGDGAHGLADLILPIGVLRQDVVVTAVAEHVSAAQLGASVTVLDQELFERLGHTELLDPLRTVPGLAVVQTGQRGGPTAVFVRGGASNFNKLLIDGVSANDIGGAFDYAGLSTIGIERVEVLRNANSVVYGTDALTGVVDITTRRGRTRRPEATVAADVGNLNTRHTDLALGGTASQFNYFGSYGRMQTDNDVPNSAYRNDTVATRFGVRLGRSDVSGTVRAIDSEAGSPNAFNHFGIADDSTSASSASYATLAVQSQWNDRLQTTIRAGSMTQDLMLTNPSPTGTPSDSSSFANYLGNPVTITGANGASVTGQGILDYGGSYPQIFSSAAERQSLFGRASYQVASTVSVSAGVRLEREHGMTSASPLSQATRNNAGGFIEARGALGPRIFINGGLGFEHNEAFGYAVTPRVSVAGYLRPPSSRSMLGDTKVMFNAGEGVKAPDLSQQLSSVFALLPVETAAANGIEAIGPERSRTMDVGLEQGLARGRARVRVSYFDNVFTDLIEYISKGVLPQLGVPSAVASALSFGAYANAQSNTSRGVELSGDAAAGRLTVAASYTYLDATVTRSLNSAALFPSSNPKFPGVSIGQYSPLVGARPFRRPTNSGSLVLGYTQGRLQISWAQYFFGAADDSTFLSDAFFGPSMLLPNKDLDAAYSRADVRASFRLHDRLRWYLSVENAFNTTYAATAGYPAPPAVARTGVTFTFGGD